MNAKASAAGCEPAANGTTTTADRETELDFTLHPDWTTEKEKVVTNTEVHVLCSGAFG